MIVYPVYVFYDQRPFCLLVMATLNFKKDFFLMTTPSKQLKQYDSNLVQMLLGLGQFKTAKIVVICLLVWLPWQQKSPIDL